MLWEFWGNVYGARFQRKIKTDLKFQKTAPKELQDTVIYK